MATTSQILEILQDLIAFGYHPPKSDINDVADRWERWCKHVDHEGLARAVNDEVLATNFWPKLPAVLQRMGKLESAPDTNEAAEVLPLLLRIMRTSAYRRANDIDHDPIAELYPFGGPRVEALQRALMAANGWRGLAQLPADLGEDMRACADIRKAYQGALMDSYNRHRREGLPIPKVGLGDMLAIERTASEKRRQLMHGARMKAIGASPMPTLIEDAARARRRATAQRCVDNPGLGLRLLGVTDE